MGAIVQRWEWRTFGDRFGAAEAAFAALTPGDVQESDEIYVLGPDPTGAHNIVKVRYGLVDVKLLREVSPDGLERWEPTLKFGLPASADDLAGLAAVIATPLGPPPDRVETMDQLLDGWLLASGQVQAIYVHKRRVRYVIGGCTAELTDVVADGRATRTIAIESEDAAAVTAAIRSVGLDGYLNTNYERALPAILAGQRPRYAVIDAGTNSVKFLVAERQDDGTWATIAERADMTRIGEGLTQGGDLSPDALDRTIAALRAMTAEARDLGAVAIAAAGTAWLRAVRDPDAAVAAIRAGSGVTIEPISGEEEGRLSYRAVQSRLGLGDGRVVVFETGGGSSQFSFGVGDQVEERFSVPVGAVSYTERFALMHAVEPAVLDVARSAIATDLSRIADRQHPDALIALGGAVTNLAAIHHGLATYDPAVVEGTVLARADIERQIDRFARLDAADRRSIIGLQPQRADVILAGACIVATVMDRLGQSSLTVSTRGLRHGLLEERFGS